MNQWLTGRIDSIFGRFTCCVASFQSQCAFTEDYDATLARFQATGQEQLQTGLAFGYAYYDLGPEPGAAVEVIEQTGKLANFFQSVEVACHNATANTLGIIEM